MSTLQPGQLIQHYRIQGKIGEGGMGEVYKAEDTRLGRSVALKLLPPETQEDSKARRRLFREARSASALSHPNIVTIHSVEESEGYAFIVMEYVEGKTLKEMIEQGPLDTSQLIEIGSQVSEALGAAHAVGLIHRDIKPSNILVTPQGQVKILDFGLAKISEVTDQPLSSENTLSRLTRTGMIVGTVAYMSPEQTRGEALDARTDIFSLGCVLYEAATGKVPFSGPSVLSVLHEIATVEPPAPSSISSEIPQGLDGIIQRALAKDREQRYTSASEMAGALRGLTFANRYQILRELGRGGMGVVYLAHDPLLEREVAIKVITPDVLSPEAVERFKREARVVAKMDHPAIVGVHDLGEHQNSLFFVMPYVQGASLRAFLNDQSLSLGEVLDIGIQVAEALEYSHSQGVVHRDIKPENIMVMRHGPENIRVRVTDFGLATATTENRLTRTGSVVGTMAYLSPEQLSAKAIDGRSDIYSLGIVLYECITGHPPFTGEVQSVLYRIAHEAPDPPRMLGAEIQEELELIVMQCLEKDPSKRAQQAGELAQALSRHRSRLQESDRMQKLSMMHGPSVQIQRPATSPLIGREKEFTELQRRMSAAALQSECQFAVVSGEAGIGKSRLLEELENIARAKKIRVLHSRFVEQDQAFPYQGFCEVIQEYFHMKMISTSSSGAADFSDLAPDLVSLFPVLAEMEDITGGQKLAVTGESRKMQDRTYIYDLLARSFVRIGGGKPLVIFFEDLHNADVSADALQYIVRRLGPTPTFIIGTYRSTEIDKVHPLSRMLDTFQGDKRFLSIELEAFSESEHQSLLQSLIGSSDLEKSFVEQIYRATEGNPHFTKELVRSLMDSGRIVKMDTGSWSLSGQDVLTSEALPATIQQTVEKRIERLPEEWKELLSIASVLGKTFDFRDLESLADGKGNLDDLVDKLIDAGFIEEMREARGDLLTFSSGVVRDVLYAGLPRRRRRSYHRKYAEQLEKKNAGRLEKVYPQLVHHYSEGDVPEKVVEYGMEMARKSLDALSPDDALRAARSVLDFVQEEDPHQEGEVHLLLAEAHRMSGDTETALRDFEAAIRVFERSKDLGRVVNATVHAAETAWEGRRVDETRKWVERGLDIAGTTAESESLARLLSLAATVANMAGEYDRARQYLEQAAKLKPAFSEKEESIPEGGTLVVALPVSVAKLHPVETTTIEENEVGGNVFETLLYTDDQGHVVPHLCEEWKVLEDAKSFHFILRRNVEMHDGRPLKAENVKACMEEGIRLTKDRLPAAYATIYGVTEFLDGSNDHVDGITVLNEYTLQIRLKEPVPIYPALMTDARTGVALSSANGSLSGTGPFLVSEFQPNRIVLKKNSRHWRGPSHLDGIEFQCGVAAAEIADGLRSGKLDLASNLLPKDLDELLQNREFGAGLAEAPKKNVYFILLNEKSEIAKIPEVRRALCGVIRIDDLVRGTLGRFAQPAIGLIPPGILGHDPGRRRQVPLASEDAIELLESLKIPFPIRLKASVHPILQDRYESLTKTLFKIWSDLGLEVSIQTPDIASYLEAGQKNEEIDLMIGRWNADYDDPDNFTYFLFHSRVGNYKYYSTDDLDRLMEDARMESDPAARARLYRRIEDLLIDSRFLLPLFHDIDYRIANPKVRKLSLRSSPPYVNYDELGRAEEMAPAVKKRTTGGILYIPMSTTLPSLDPQIMISLQQGEVLPNIFETLTRQTEGGQVVPWLASEFHAQEQGRRFRFRLRDDVRFHDGRRLTARDVRYSLEKLLQHDASQCRWLISVIRGAGKMMEGKARELEGFQIVSATEFYVDLDQPISFFPALLSYPGLSIVAEGSDRFEGNWREGCVGTGPFRLQGFEPNRRLELEANPNYWRSGYPKSEGLVFLFGISPQEILSGFRAGRFSLATDLIPQDVEALRHDPELASGYRDSPRLSTHYIGFNIHRGPLSEEALRHRLIQAIDVESLVRQHIGKLGVLAHGLIPPGLPGYEPGRRRMSAPKQSQPGEEIELATLMHSQYEGPFASLTRDLIDRLQENGFRIRVEGTKAELVNFYTVADKIDVIMMRWLGDYPDADSFINGLLNSKTGIAGAFCGIPEMDRLIDRGRKETRPQLRHGIYREAEQLIAKRALLVPLFHEQTYRFARPEVEGLQVTFAIQSIPYENLSVRK